MKNKRSSGKKHQFFFFRSHSHIFYAFALDARATLFTAVLPVCIWWYSSFDRMQCVCACECECGRVYAVCVWVCVCVNGNSWIRPQANRKTEREIPKWRNWPHSGDQNDRERMRFLCLHTHIRHMVYRRLAVGQWPGGVHAEFSTFRSEVSYTAIWAHNLVVGCSSFLFFFVFIYLFSLDFSLLRGRKPCTAVVIYFIYFIYIGWLTQCVYGWAAFIVIIIILSSFSSVNA